MDREKEEKSVTQILELIKKTHINSMEIPEGHFAAGISHGDEIISMATDGVGTKVLLAQEFKDFKTVGIDCVAMNVNDLITTGSIPVAFVDYIAIEKHDNDLVADLVEGLVEGCLESEIPLIGGETAIMSEVIKGYGNGFDIAGTALGIQQKSKLITGEKISEGDLIIGIESSGVHSNGLSLARKIGLSEEDRKKLLKPTRIYVKAIKSLLNSGVEIKGMAHITGGGFTNLLRLGKWHYKLQRWKIMPIFRALGEHIEEREMYRTFNMGIGYTVIVSPEEREETLSILRRYYPAIVIGEIIRGDDVTLEELSLR